MLKTALSAALLAGASASSSLQCLDESGKPVDWWFTYKMNDGVQYAYKDSNDASYTALQVEPSKTLDDTSSAWGGTLDQFYKADTDSLLYVLYNDEFPDSAPAPVSNDEGAHAKGVMASDGSGGFWLIHSVPEFPPAPADASSYSSFTGATTYGQTALCITLDASTADSIAAQLEVEHLLIYAKNVPSDLESSLPNLAALATGTHASDDSAQMSFKSAGGHSFDLFSKSPSWGKDIGEDLIEPYYKKGFSWETWRRSPFLDTYCAGSGGYDYDSININGMAFNTSEPSYEFAYTKDHAKWGISESGETVCVGGLNRMDSQRQRGGGFACFERAALYNSLQKVIGSADSC